ncbi:MAG: hypothetical protein A3C30_03445 [Candidatus Levybacteria bacterium RIFCSPHIGHO2_02_FULL_40_18]|nr:MAG: hypothetical protein A2869_01795 [Candidatus Levybacteria bacterium RIFCSPHIGHO2_01_FULL_40_58]OGH26140.1 MAG: hypothetical protein A3C30_03445 [Candidatus Levybacteria bacterium RIFCSPHIGHO2_02_FULL_40_18]OGH31312.1 MAG: hypothetical protein A3E43_03060 [Candidatus Levybacteria bacterium RIFCSPHIGHO2_12_FULL_40_31]OGH39969.1 MAG: hypothetical protein A2894_02795 [Candidatus Levybacteria bacterium RIFCSPLOWO2_01_FULL_40_64]OGH49615.1 MAG: hypothetical protein A3I54_05230 [Candidatus Lev
MKKILPVIAIIILLIVIKNNISGIFKTLEDENTAGNLKEKLSEEQRENLFLKERLFYVKTNQFVEEEAREKLLMNRPGEYVVIAPTSAPLNREKIEVETRPNWQKWFELFF